MEDKYTNIRTYQEVPKRAKNSIYVQLNKLINRYGEKSVRLVVMKYIGNLQEKRLIEKTIKIKEEELDKLRRIK